MGQLGLSETMGSVAMPSPPRPIDQSAQDVLHCLTCYGTPNLNLEILHRVEGIFEHTGPYRAPDEVWGQYLEPQWVYDSLLCQPDPVKANQRQNIALQLLQYCKVGAPALAKEVYMKILHLGYAFVKDQVVNGIHQNIFQFPTNTRGEIEWPFRDMADLLETLRDQHQEIAFQVTHPCGSDELFRWVGSNSTEPLTSPFTALSVEY